MPVLIFPLLLRVNLVPFGDKDAFQWLEDLALRWWRRDGTSVRA
jgi:hypothetical protein